MINADDEFGGGGGDDEDSRVRLVHLSHIHRKMDSILASCL